MGCLLAGPDLAADKEVLAAGKDNLGQVRPEGCAGRMAPVDCVAAVALDMQVVVELVELVVELVEDLDRGGAAAADLVVVRSTSPAAADSIDHIRAERLAASVHFHCKSYLTCIYSLFRFIYKDVKMFENCPGLTYMLHPMRNKWYLNFSIRVLTYKT